MGKFNKDLAQKTTLETMGGNDGPPDTSGVEIKSPGKMYWFTVKGVTFNDLLQITTTQLYDPDGELETYIIQADNNSLREKIINKASQTARKAIERGLNGNWIKAKWKDNSVGWQSWSHPGTDKKPEWLTMEDDEVIDQVFDGRIIDSLDHEALLRNAGGKV